MRDKSKQHEAYNEALIKFEESLYEFLHKSAITDKGHIEAVCNYLLRLLEMSRSDPIELSAIVEKKPEQDRLLILNEIEVIMTYHSRIKAQKERLKKKIAGQRPGSARPSSALRTSSSDVPIDDDENTEIPKPAVVAVPILIPEFKAALAPRLDFSTRSLNLSLDQLKIHHFYSIGSGLNYINEMENEIQDEMTRKPASSSPLSISSKPSTLAAQKKPMGKSPNK